MTDISFADKENMNEKPDSRIMRIFVLMFKYIFSSLGKKIIS